MLFICADIFLKTYIFKENREYKDLGREREKERTGGKEKGRETGKSEKKRTTIY